LLRWKGQVPAGKRISRIAGAIDLFPTFADLAGVTIPAGKPLDGKSLKPLILRTPAEWPDRMIFTAQNGRVSVRTQRFRLDPTGQLFDLEADPMQDRNVASEHPDLAAKLRAAAAAWAREVLPGPDNRPFTAGYAKNTLLPARDGVPHGSIERSSKHPNCTYFKNWTAMDDSMTWDVEVGRTGKYEATIYYTCPAADIGSTVELSFLGARVSAKVSQAWDPPLIGEAYDRAPRTESLVKDFKPLRLGTLQLEKARGQLTLRAIEIPGKQVADIRYVALRLLDE
jgi:hypothetical protein